MTWAYFRSAFQNLLGASYIEARRREFIGQTQDERSMIEYEVEFLRLSRYALSWLRLIIIRVYDSRRGWDMP